MNGPKAQAGFLDVIKGLKDRFYTIEEFPLLDRGVLPQGILLRAMEVPKDKLEYFAFRLRGKELEGLLLELKDTYDEKIIERAYRILAVRLTTRILKLLAILFQYNYTSFGLITVLDKLSTKIRLKENYNAAEAFFWHLGQAEDKFAVLGQIIDEHGKDINKALRELNISSNSPFAQEAAFKYLKSVSKDGFTINLKWMVRTIENRTTEELQGLMTHYLSAFTIKEYHDGINLSILSKLGQPNISTDWAPYDRKLQDKFTQWYFLNRLKKHTISMPKKFDVLAKYHKQVRNSYEIAEEDLMIIDFGDIVIADIANRPYSYFYEKNVFEKEMAAWEKSKVQEDAANESSIDSIDKSQVSYQPTFLRMDKKNLTARDFMIEEIEAPCIKLSYEGIDILYINEMMDIKIGLEPDMRRKQLAKLRKRKIIKKPEKE